MADAVTYSRATGEELGKLINAMEKVLVGAPENHVVMACLALAITIQCPNIQPQQLSEGVRGVSEWIALFGSSLEEPDVPDVVN